MKRQICVILMGIAGSGGAVAAEPPFALDAPIDGPASAYTKVILELVKKWPAPGLPGSQSAWMQSVKTDNPVQLDCYATEGNPTYIGLRQLMLVKAPLSTVAGILDDVPHYKDLFPGYDDVHIVSRDRNRMVTFWEQHIPLFFVPNEKFEITYQVDAFRGNDPARKIYRYQLKSGKSVKNNDGAIFLDEVAPGLTRYVEYDFFDADWGFLKTLGEEKVWHESLDGIYLSDVAIWLKAETPALSYAEIKERSEKVLARFPTKECWAARRKFAPIFAGKKFLQPL